jgi:glycosyltransferase involved in cell wall biosynthesis
MTDESSPLVSVVIITFNHSAYIERALLSVMSQRVPFPVEIILGEDCSSDGTREIVTRLFEEYPGRVRLLLNAQNIGACRNLTQCERAAKGKYIAYCEGDDYWHDPYKLAKQVDILERDSNCVLVHSDVDSFDSRTSVVTRALNRMEGVTRDKNGGDLLVAILQHRYRVRTCSAIVRREVLIECLDADPILFESGRFQMGDTPRWVELCKKGEFNYIDAPLATYCLSQRSLSRPDDPKKLAEFYLGILDMLQYLGTKHRLNNEIRPFIRQTVVDGLILAHKAGDARIARQALSFCERPSAAMNLLAYATAHKKINPLLASTLWSFIKYIKRKATERRLLLRSVFAGWNSRVAGRR